MVRKDAIVVGAGFAGLRTLYTLREIGLDTTVLEAGEDLGGVWYFNGYPGARCDVESYDYSYRFSPELEQEWRWSERYAQQPEILSYIRHVAERFDLRRHVVFNTAMTRATYDEAAAIWHVEARDGRSFVAPWLIMCVGQLSLPKRPDYPGQSTFRGQIIHSAIWPKSKVDLADKRVAIIGTGSSGMQMTPVVAEVAKHLTVFQRTANFSVPAANSPVSEEEDREVKSTYRDRRNRAANSPTGLGFVPNRKSALDDTTEQREVVYEAAYNRWGFGFALAYYDILLNKAANDTAADFVRRKIRARINDPLIGEKLVPKDHAFASRRPSVDSGYFEAFNRDNVELADLREAPILEFTPTGIRTAVKHHEFDVVILATGFDVFTGSLLKPEIVGRGGLTLKAKWASGPVTQLGVGVADFPNFFIVVGPGSPSLLSNVIVSTEEQLDWFAKLIRTMRRERFVEFEATHAAEQAWVAHVNERAQETLYPTANSFYVGSEIAGKPRVFMPYSGGVRHYRRLLDECAAEGYSGFDLRHTPRGASHASHS